MHGGTVSLFLCGDVMLGRGVDQILPHPGDPALREPSLTDARSYVALARAANGPFPHPVDPARPWGDALAVLDENAPDVRVVNLETSVTRSGAFAPGKQVHYRMHPANLPCLAAARPDVCALANNHVLDFGRRGLAETLHSLEAAELPAAGAGRNLEQAARPVTVPVGGGRRVVVLSFGMPSSGIPVSWAASRDTAGVHLVTEPSDAAADAVAARLAATARPGDVTLASVHWGSNWGHRIPPEQVRFGHALVDRGVDVVHGHSSHHPRAVEVHRGRLVLHGCGDLVDDYEGITGHEEYRDDLRLLWFAEVGAGTGRTAALRAVPVRARRMRLRRASREETAWLRSTLQQACEPFGTRVRTAGDGSLSFDFRSPARRTTAAERPRRAAGR
ncbi:CapA family protein [Streptomyces sp. TR06-5]|uniref:CapA family protein n=1 Tax=unclassified Streptomyces TaxID=2593676 RepID=UPI0039A11E27